MKVAVSNLAWSPADRVAAYRALRAHGVTGLEIAPRRFFASAPDPFHPTDREASEALAPIADVGLEIVSMQAILFGAEGAALFEGDAALSRFRIAMSRAFQLAHRFGIPHLVFGSPKQRRVPDTLSMEAARAHAVSVFRGLGDEAMAAGTRLGVEPNPPEYGTNFLVDLREVESFVADVDHPAVSVVLDLGAMQLRGTLGGIADLTATRMSRISHVHLSEPHLVPAIADPRAVAGAMTALARTGYGHWYSVEMLASEPATLETLSATLGRLTAAMEMAQRGESA